MSSIWSKLKKEHKAIGVTLRTVSLNDSVQGFTNGPYVLASSIVANGANGYIFNAGASPFGLGITLGARLPNGKAVVINGPANFQLAGASVQSFSVTQYLSSFVQDEIPEPNPDPPAPFSPSDISDMLFWYDASDADTITTDGIDDITNWEDLSGNGHHLSQATDSFQPSYLLEGQNGLNVATFDTNDFMTTSAITHDIGTGDYTLVMCFRKAPDAFGVWQAIADFNTAKPGYQLSTGGANHVLTVVNTSSKVFSDTLVGDTDMTLSIVRSGGNLRLWINTAADSGNPKADVTSVNNGVFMLGQSDTSFFDGRGYEFIMYKKAVTDEERVELETYLNDKWGIVV